MGPVKVSWEPVRKREPKRLKQVGWILFGLLIVVLVRAFTIQVVKLKNAGSKMPIYNERSTLQAKRGLIYDRNMNILAMDVPCFSAAIDPSILQDPEQVSKDLASVLGGAPAAYHTLIDANRHSAFVWLKKDLNNFEKEGLDQLKIKGVILRRDRKRAHPCPSIACQVLGWTNASYQGVGGIEQTMDAVLRGEEGWEILQKDGKNRNYASPDYPSVQPKNGQNVVLTLDQVTQTVVEEELERGVLAYRAKGGTAVLMDPFSGEIFSMASVLDRPENSQESDVKYLIQNRAVQTEFEPGSTLKIVTAAAALEEGIFTPGSIIHCENGVYRLAGQVIHDHDKRYDYLTFSQVIEYSSNIGAAKISKKLGKKALFQYIQNFGFGTTTGIDLPGETPGILWPVYEWSDFSTATIAFGQGLSVNTLQLACMGSVIANGGTLVKPRIVQAVVDENGHVLHSRAKETIRRVISENTAFLIRQIMEKTVTQGNAREAGVAGISVGGKTGTAQKSLEGSKGYSPGSYTSSFVGFWPVDIPRFVLVVVLEEPKGMYYAAQSCAPIFSNIVKRMVGLPSSPIVPSKEQETDQKEARFVFSNYHETSVTKPVDALTPVSFKDETFRVPRLTGLSLRAALQKLAVCGIEAKVEGHGVVKEQYPGPGEKVVPRMVCQLICK